MRRGCARRCARNSAETALALFQRGYEIDIAVIDVHLSGNMDGLELARVLRAIGCCGADRLRVGHPV